MPICHQKFDSDKNPRGETSEPDTPQMALKSVSRRMSTLIATIHEDYTLLASKVYGKLRKIGLSASSIGRKSAS